MGLERALRLIFAAALPFGVAGGVGARFQGRCAVAAALSQTLWGFCCLRTGRSRGVCVPAPLLRLGSCWVVGLVVLLAKCRLLGLHLGSSCCCEPRAGSELKTWDRRGEALGSPSSAPGAEGLRDSGCAVLESTSGMGLRPLASPALCVSAWTTAST